MSEAVKVKRYKREHEDVPLDECEVEDGDMVTFSDYDALAERCMALEEVVRKLTIYGRVICEQLYGCGMDKSVTPIERWDNWSAKALALVGEKSK